MLGPDTPPEVKFSGEREAEHSGVEFQMEEPTGQGQMVGAGHEMKTVSLGQDLPPPPWPTLTILQAIGIWEASFFPLGGEPEWALGPRSRYLRKEEGVL